MTHQDAYPLPRVIFKWLLRNRTRKNSSDNAFLVCSSQCGCCLGYAMLQRFFNALWNQSMVIWHLISCLSTWMMSWYSSETSVQEKLDLVFSRDLRDHGLKLNPKKCFLLRPEVKFLGHMVCKEGVQVDMEKVCFGGLAYSLFCQECEAGCRVLLLTLCPSLCVGG